MLKQLINKIAGQPPVCSNHDSNLDELRQIVESLPSWEQRWAGNGDRIVEIDTANGTSIAKGLHKEPTIAVALCESKEGTVFDIHSHMEKEIIVQFEGSQDIEFDNNETIRINAGDVLVIPPGINHKACYPVNSRCIAITLPAAYGFPGGGRFSERTEDEPAT